MKTDNTTTEHEHSGIYCGVTDDGRTVWKCWCGDWFTKDED